MPNEPNYLLGRGENLTIPIQPRRGGGNKSHPYSFDDAKSFVSKRAESTSRLLDTLPRAACPGDMAVAVMTLHPAYLAKTYSPLGLLAAAGLKPIGSRGASVVPRVAPKGVPTGQSVVTTELFVTGTRRQFRNFAGNLPTWTTATDGAPEVIRIEDFRAPVAADRIRPLRSQDANPLIEVVLHGAGLQLGNVLDGFRNFIEINEIAAEFGRELLIGSMAFVPLRLPRLEFPRIADFAFLRVAREMPPLRISDSNRLRFFMRTAARSCSLPSSGPIDPTLVAAIFDGGLPEIPNLGTWAQSFDTPNLGPSVPDFEEHGLAVTSALLFGPLDEGQPAPVPYGRVDHYRVLDEQTQADPQGQVYPVLERILKVLAEKPYQFINLSIGPDEPVEDDQVSAWTAALDQLFADGQSLVTAAVGNSGERDEESGLNRIQAPSDGVNILGIAACERDSRPFKRSTYSSIGPGRSPGRGKPDLSIFGGSHDDPFWVLKAGTSCQVVGEFGTSFAAPNALRVGLGVRAGLGNGLLPLAARALMLHRSEENCGPAGEDVEHDRTHLGWGRSRTSLEDLLTCSGNMIYVIYQGIIQPRQYLRAEIPTPPGELPGKVQIGATICYASGVDPEYPSSYTRSGLEVVFRPHAKKFDMRKNPKSGKKTRSTTPAPKPFFNSHQASSESDLREEGKWETTLCAYKKLRGDSLFNPVFELHHLPRLGGATVAGADAIPYAMVVQLCAENCANLYNLVRLKYGSVLEPLVPQIDISLRA